MWRVYACPMRHIAIGLLFCLGAFASATNISGTVSVDNEWSVYLSTDDSQLGTLISGGTDWTSPQSFNVSLTSGHDYFLHVVGFNDGGPDMFIGSFSLSDAGFQFANGFQNIDTDTSHWVGN